MFYEGAKVRWCYCAMVLGMMFASVSIGDEAQSFFQRLEQRPEFKEAQAFVQSIQKQAAHPKSCSSKNDSTVAPSLFSTEQTPSHDSTTLIFVSFSLGEPALMQYAHEAKKAGAALVFRGLLGDSMKATVLKLQKIVQKTQASFLIDPLAFRRFDIQKVPAVVITGPAKNHFDVVYGLTTLEYALEKMAHKGDAALQAASALQKLRGRS